MANSQSRILSNSIYKNQQLTQAMRTLRLLSVSHTMARRPTTGIWHQAQSRWFSSSLSNRKRFYPKIRIIVGTNVRNRRRNRANLTTMLRRWILLNEVKEMLPAPRDRTMGSLFFHSWRSITSRHNTTCTAIPTALLRLEAIRMTFSTRSPTLDSQRTRSITNADRTKVQITESGRWAEVRSPWALTCLSSLWCKGRRGNHSRLNP